MAHPLAKRSPELEQRVLDALAKGTSITRACQSNGIDPASVKAWADNDPAFGARYAAAIDAGFDAMADETLDIIDAEPEMTVSEGGAKRRDSAFVAWQKARVETRLKILAKRAPHKYGDAVQVNVAGKVDVAHDNPAVTELVALVRAAKRGDAIPAPAPRLAGPAGDASDADEFL